LIENALACIANVAAAIRSCQVGFLLPPTNRFEDVRNLDRCRLFGLQDLVNFLVVTVRDIWQLVPEVMDAGEGSRVRVFLHSIFFGDVPSELRALVKELNEGISRFALLNRERSSFGGV
jgi:hypothetical protein